MTIPTQLCSKCHEDFMNCKCENFHPNIPTHSFEKNLHAPISCNICGEEERFHTNIESNCPRCGYNQRTTIEIEQEVCSRCGTDFSDIHEFTVNELRAIYRTIEHQYISYEDQEAHEVINKIAKIVKENES